MANTRNRNNSNGENN
jgi:hypothetical protein